MELKVPKIPVCVAIACCGVALVFQLVAVGGSGWAVNKQAEIEIGLFRTCFRGECNDIQSSKQPDWFRATQAFSILGLLAIAGSLAVGILHAVLENTRVLCLLAIASCAASVVALLIEVAVFGGEMGDEIRATKDVSFGYGFILSIIACILSVGAAACFALGLGQSHTFQHSPSG
ncbi:epithelial membrane protein 1-like [Pomacea canaliculata]|uniref:epithelial membrane protein 1-like n=1 Tax=Pomacea canaliculata TaxID=400727 RepID=UPI000D738B05|nr:epithelial membrane protein 1-like [Pomacea canaliculata]